MGGEEKKDGEESRPCTGTDASGVSGCSYLHNTGVKTELHQQADHQAAEHSCSQPKEQKKKKARINGCEQAPDIAVQ